MSRVLPYEIDPRRLAAEGVHLEGQIPIGVLSRLSRMLGDTAGQIGVALSFDHAAGGGACIHGDIYARLALVCQRCLGQLAFDARIEIRLLPIGEGQAPPEVAAGYEILEMTADTLELERLVEDELLLAIPTVPRHPHGECTSPANCQLEPSTTESIQNPFAVLRTADAKRNLD